MAVEKNNLVVVEHELPFPVAKVFAALGQGRLFFNCGAYPEETQIDFRRGGKYQLNFAHHGKSYGEFLDIVENKHISFTWNSDEMEIKGTRVVIDLVPSPKGCMIKLRHEGFADKDLAEGHEGGWCGGLEGMEEEMAKFRVHMEREFVAPVEMLYDACSGANWLTLMGVAAQSAKADFRVGGRYSVQLQKGEAHGEFTAIEKNKKIAFTWQGTPGGFNLDKPTLVTLEFGPWGDNGKNSYIELTHEGLSDEEQALRHHGGWNQMIWGLYKKVCR